MSYAKTTWKDRVVERPLTFTMTNNPDGTVTLTPSEGQIVEPGTPINAVIMNNLEKQYDTAVEWAKGFGLGDVAKDISGTNLNDLAMTGFYKGNNLSNSPDGTTGWFFIINQRHTSSHIAQIAMKYADSTNMGIYRRRSNGGSWSAWGEMETAAGAQSKVTNTLAEYGIGTIVKNLGTVDMNTINPESGFYFIASTSTNQPISGVSFNIIVTKYNSNTSHMIALSQQSATKYFARRLSAGVWGAWQEIAITDMITPFGLGQHAQLPPGNTLAASTPSGLYRVDNTTVERGGQTFAGTCLVIGHNSGAKSQLVTNTATGQMYVRGSNTSGVFTNWVELLTDLAPTWTNLTLLNGATSARTPRYTKVGRLVTIEGEIGPLSAAGVTIATLPVGFRPPTTRYFKVVQVSGTSNDGADIYVDSSGNVHVRALANTVNNISLMGINFYVD